MPNYDILFLDMDGTLLNSEKTVSPRTQKALKAAREAGVRLVAATGRTLKIAPPMLRELDFDYAIVSNGASIYDLRSGERIYHNPFGAEAARVLYDLIRDDCDFIEFFADGEIILSKRAHDMLAYREVPSWHRKYFTENETPVWESEDAYIAAGAPGLEKVGLVRYKEEVLRRIKPRLEATGLFNITGSIARSMEINDKTCSKGVAIAEMCRTLGIDIARAAAMGDSTNDLEMIKTAGCGVAMGNAKPVLKEAADYITDSNDEDGVAKFVEEKVL
ncbi:MAG: HAD family phosphatase [Clostridia bacterium]|nr:HAD family phosphatase [Clostridia bacterium]